MTFVSITFSYYFILGGMSTAVGMPDFLMLQQTAHIQGKGSNPYTVQHRALGLQEVEGPRIFRQLVHEGGKVVSPTHPVRG